MELASHGSGRSGLQAVLYGPGDIAQTAFARRVLHLAGAIPDPDFGLDPIYHSRDTGLLDFTPNLFPCDAEAVTNGDRVFGLLQTDSDSQVRLLKQGCTCAVREVNHRAGRSRGKSVFSFLKSQIRNF